MTVKDDCATGRLQVLLEEYRTLRAEINSRINGRFTLTGVFIASAALVLAKDLPPWWPWILGAVAAALGISWAYSWHLAKSLHTRLVVLERKINAEAAKAYGEAGGEETLLNWETSR